ncbi:acyl-CoA-binding domain-containing protein 5 isoform X1 [Pieris rapae]|uniref:acyl-CoA-binding domain-containing protein 5 isoform X1 n=1 Tax=Pieris rapae TaxID=64459 RepID=UPI001E27DE01|nr:acyl-CoA-binding domain-containing protein 5 isoform X1 [Pieris rapae]
MSIEEKFHAAVNVIKNLPKSGPYQPSHELMLKFYSYFKQATEGSCTKPKPGFWDVINRAKWEAWAKLGDMTKEEAMECYVDELHKIVETMSLNSNVESFLTLNDNGEGFPSADLQLVAGDILGRCQKESQQNSPAYSRSVSGASSPVPDEVSSRTRHDSEDEFIDTVDVSAPIDEPVTQSAPRLSNGHAYQITSQLTHLKVLEQLPGTLARLEADVAALRKAVEGDRRILDQVSSGWRWPWQELSAPTLAFVIIWPFVAFRLMNRTKRHST